MWGRGEMVLGLCRRRGLRLGTIGWTWSRPLVARSQCRENDARIAKGGSKSFWGHLQAYEADTSDTFRDLDF